MFLKKIFIFGCSELSKHIIRCISNDYAEVIGYIDNNPKKQGTYFNNYKVINPEKIVEYNYDYIFIGLNKYTTVSYNSILKQLIKLGVLNDKIIEFFDIKNDKVNEISKFIDVNTMLFEAYKCKIEDIETYLNNLEYELIDKIRNNEIRMPIIYSADKALEKIVNDKCSITRFGDGEFRIMLGDNIIYQDFNEKLKNRLREIIVSNDNNIIIGLRNFFGSLDKFDYETNIAQRRFFWNHARESIYSLFDMNKVYYDALLFRPYMVFNDKSNSKRYFEEMKKIWNNRDVVIVEGEYTRLGIGNDLFENAKSINRIITKNCDAFGIYDKILEKCIERIDKNKLVLIALGPTATVLAYDLHKNGYQTIDIGHIDIEYECYIKNTNDLNEIKNKYTVENFGVNNIENVLGDIYQNQIIEMILE